jgi:hypothetical protein
MNSFQLRICNDKHCIVNQATIENKPSHNRKQCAEPRTETLPIAYVSISLLIWTNLKVACLQAIIKNIYPKPEFA